MRSVGSTPQRVDIDIAFIQKAERLSAPFPRLTYRHVPIATLGLLILAASCAVLAISPARAGTQQPNSPNQATANMPGMDMSGKGDMADMKDMGPSMAAMAGHMYVTPVRPKQAGDEQKAMAVVKQVKASIERYKDYKKALADRYVI